MTHGTAKNKRVRSPITTFLLCVLFLVAGTVASAAQEKFDYDPLGRLVRVVDEQGRVTNYVYDPAGNLL